MSLLAIAHLLRRTSVTRGGEAQGLLLARTLPERVGQYVWSTSSAFIGLSYKNIRRIANDADTLKHSSVRSSLATMTVILGTPPPRALVSAV